MSKGVSHLVSKGVPSRLPGTMMKHIANHWSSTVYKHVSNPLRSGRLVYRECRHTHLPEHRSNLTPSTMRTGIAAEGLSGPCGIRLGSTDEGEIGMIYFISTLRIEGTTLPEEFNPPLDFG